MGHLSSKALAIAAAAAVTYTAVIVGITVQVAGRDDEYCRQLAEAQAQQRLILDRGVKPFPFSTTDGKPIQLLK